MLEFEKFFAIFLLFMCTKWKFYSLKFVLSSQEQLISNSKYQSRFWKSSTGTSPFHVLKKSVKNWVNSWWSVLVALLSDYKLENVKWFLLFLNLHILTAKGSSSPTPSTSAHIFHSLLLIWYESTLSMKKNWEKSFLIISLHFIFQGQRIRSEIKNIN